MTTTLAAWKHLALIDENPFVEHELQSDYILRRRRRRRGNCKATAKARIKFETIILMDNLKRMVRESRFL